MSNQTQDTSSKSGQSSDQNTDTSNESGGKYVQISKNDIIIEITIILVLIIISILVCNLNKLNELSDLGDYLAGTFAVLAWLWLIFTAYLQYEELKLQREELKLQRKELEKSVNAQQGTEKALSEQLEITRQQFELYRKELEDRKPKFQIEKVEPQYEWVENNDRQLVPTNIVEIICYLYNVGGEFKPNSILCITNNELGIIDIKTNINIFYIKIGKTDNSYINPSELHGKEFVLYVTILNGHCIPFTYHFVVNDDNIELKEGKFETNSEQNTGN